MVPKPPMEHPARPPSGQPQTHQQPAQRCQLHIACDVCRHAEFWSFTSFNACFRKVAGGRLVTRDALREYEGHKPSFASVLTWVTRGCWSTSTTVTGTVSPSSVNRRIMPTLVATRVAQTHDFSFVTFTAAFNWLQAFYVKDSYRCTT
jgi:hypothetical protein